MFWNQWTRLGIEAVQNIVGCLGWPTRKNDGRRRTSCNWASQRFGVRPSSRPHRDELDKDAIKPRHPFEMHIPVAKHILPKDSLSHPGHVYKLVSRSKSRNEKKDQLQLAEVTSAAGYTRIFLLVPHFPWCRGQAQGIEMAGQVCVQHLEE